MNNVAFQISRMYQILNRAKLFLENFFIYGFFQGLNYLIPFLLLPIITRLLPNPSEFGIFDIFTLVLSFGTVLAVMGLYDAMFREYFEKDDQTYRYNVATTAQRLVLISSFILGLIITVFSNLISTFFFASDTYGNVIIFSAIALFLSANMNLISGPTRIQNHRKEFVISGLISSTGYSLLAVILLYTGLSIYGLIYSKIIASLLLIIYFLILNRKFFSFGKFKTKIAKDLLKIGIPLVPSFLIYWIFSSIDRLFIVNILGTNELGIYAVGGRMALLSMFVYMAFASGWQYFAFSTMKDTDQVLLNSRIFEYLAVIAFISLIMIFPFIKLIFILLFTGEYQKGYIVVPYLYISPLLLMLFQVVANQFIIIKKSYWPMFCLTIGLISNILLNLILIKIIGIEGASIASMSGYIMALISACIITIKMDLLVLSKRFIFIIFLTILFFLGVRIVFFENFYEQILLGIILVFIYLFSYKTELKMIFNQMKKYPLNQLFLLKNFIN